MVTVSLGTKKKTYKSIRLAAEAANIPYITLYMRLRVCEDAAKAMRKPVRKYERSNA